MQAGTPVMFGVGATKAGTSWLHDYLSGHPGCHFRSIKELHYFDMIAPKAQARQVARLEAEVEVLALAQAQGGARSARLTQRVRDLQDWLGVLRTRPSGRDLADAAYLGFVTDGALGRLGGDVTPSYAMMPDAAFRRMIDLTPLARVVYLMRDPVSRLWSHVRMMAQRAGATDFAAASGRLLDRVLAAGDGAGAHDIYRRGDYRAALARLFAVVPGARLLVLFMEDLMTAPGVARLCGFLGLGPHTARFDRRVHEGLPLALAPSQRAAAQALLQPQYDTVARYFPDLPAAWLRGRNGPEA